MHVIVCVFLDCSELRIDKGSLRGALYLGTCIHNNESCNGISYIL